MARAYKGDKPCPQCGTVPQKYDWDTQRDSVHSICRACERLLQDARSRKIATEGKKFDNLVHVKFRSFHTSPLIDKYRGPIQSAIDRHALTFLKSVELKGVDTRDVGGERIRMGVSATTCAWFDGVVAKEHWDALQEFVVNYNNAIMEYIGDVNELIDQAYQDGQNLLINLNKDQTLVGKINKRGTIK